MTAGNNLLTEATARQIQFKMLPIHLWKICSLTPSSFDPKRFNSKQYLLFTIKNFFQFSLISKLNEFSGKVSCDTWYSDMIQFQSEKDASSNLEVSPPPSNWLR